MSRKNPIHGWIILDKPVGISSAQAVGKVKYWLRPEKIGHAGTLDPLASGILPLALGEATKTMPYMVSGIKSYRFTVQWGEERETDDREGRITATSKARPSPADIQAVLPQFTGLISQLPPTYSAIKVAGERAYALARAGESVTLSPRPVQVDRLMMEENHNGDSTTFSVICGKGTYIRSLARDMGQKLGCLGHVAALRRLSVGKFSEKDAISLDYLEKIGHTPAPETLISVVLPVPSALDDILAQEVDEAQSARLRVGASICLGGEIITRSMTLALMHRGKLVAIAQEADGWLKPVRVFNY